MKYIIINNHKGLGPCLFPITKTHADIAKIFMKPGEKIFSAGFVSVGPDGVKCYGKSRSLKVTSQKNDTKIINKAFNGELATTFDH